MQIEDIMSYISIKGNKFTKIQNTFNIKRTVEGLLQTLKHKQDQKELTLKTKYIGFDEYNII